MLRRYRKIAAFQRRKIEDVTPTAMILQQKQTSFIFFYLLLSSSNSLYLPSKWNLRKSNK